VHEDEHLLILGSPDGWPLAPSENAAALELPRNKRFGFLLAL